MQGSRIYQSVVARPLDDDHVKVVARLHIELSLDTTVTEVVSGHLEQEEEFHDTSILSDDIPVEAAVGRVWDRVAETEIPPNPLDELRELVKTAERLRVAAANSDAPDWERADEAAHDVAIFMRDFFKAPTTVAGEVLPDAAAERAAAKEGR
ncbi:hypothetical protein ACFY05_32285 [Microtetraspora fusca]|uniref:Uncharacterized protein n=1 Tax=Microtetraspora fusca TaxID=1997 RepID=A0ABW6VF60_MICFU